MAFESHAPNLDNMKDYLSNEQRKQQGDNDGPVWWSLPNGMSSVRILPPWDPTGRVAIAVNMHPIEYQGKDMRYKKYNWTCSKKTFDKPCKICEGLQQLSAAGADVSKWEANRRQFYMNAIVMHDPRYQASINAGKKPEEADGVAPGTHVLMRSPKTLYDWVISQITNPMVGDITSLTNGIDIYITKEGEGLGTKYTPTLSPNGRTPVPQEYLDKIEALYNLDEVFSRGFDEQLIDELVSHLKKSAGVMASNIPNMVNQMAGYPTPNVAPPAMAPNYMNPQMPQQYAPPQTPQAPAMSNPAMMANPGMPNIAPSQFAVPSQPMSSAPGNFQQPVSSPMPTSPMMTSPSDSQASPLDVNLPKCFGNYNPSQVNCVVCPSEIPCSQRTANG